MNQQTNTTTEEDIPQLNENCACCLSVPISHLSLETDPPIGGWLGLFKEMDIRVLVDPAGRPAISTLAARKLLASRKRSSELAAEDHARRFAELDKKRPRAVGVPAIEGASPYESLLATGGIVSPSAEFSDVRPRPQFLEEALAEGAAADAEKRRAVAEKKERLVDQMQEELGRKP